MGKQGYECMFQGSIPVFQVSDGAGIQTRKATTSLPAVQAISSTSTYQRRLTTCKTELQHLVQQKREQCNAERMAKQMMESAEWETKPPPPGNPMQTFLYKS